MQIEPRPVADLVPYARNSRTHSAEQIAQIAASIEEFGFTNPVLIDPEGGIIAGHGRVLAAQALGMTEVPTIVLSHLSDAQRRAYVIADNKLALNSAWDHDLLRSEVLALGEEIDLDLLGFGDDLQNVLLERLDGENDPGTLWQGMPSFENEDKTAFRSLAIHFADQAAVDAFAKKIGQTITDKTRFVWFPEIVIETYADKRYVAE